MERLCAKKARALSKSSSKIYQLGAVLILKKAVVKRKFLIMEEYFLTGIIEI